MLQAKHFKKVNDLTSIFSKSIIQLAVLTITLFGAIIAALVILLYILNQHQLPTKTTASQFSDDFENIKTPLVEQSTEETVSITFPVNELNVRLPTIFAANFSGTASSIKSALFELKNTATNETYTFNAAKSDEANNTNSWEVQINPQEALPDGAYQVTAQFEKHDGGKIMSNQITVTLSRSQLF